MNIVEDIPRNVGSKIKFHFCHPTAIMIENYWREPEILKKNWLIAQLNRYNWLTFSSHLHNYGSSTYGALWRRTVYAEDSPLAWKLRLHKNLDITTHVNGVIFVLGDLNFTIQNLRRVKRKLWKCNKRGIHYKDHNEWKKRSLYGGIYPIGKRPKAYVPRNPWTRKWNLRWKKGSKLSRLCLKKWQREPWRMCVWGGAGTVIKRLDGSEYIFMGILNTDYIPSRLGGVDAYI